MTFDGQNLVLNIAFAIANLFPPSHGPNFNFSNLVFIVLLTSSLYLQTLQSLKFQNFQNLFTLLLSLQLV